MLTQLKKDLQKTANDEKALLLQRFFKTGPGEYAEGDRFLGIAVPVLRKFAKNYQTLKLTDIKKLLCSKWHEERCIALFILTLQYRHTKDLTTQRTIYNFYQQHMDYINNWDLVDCSAAQIMGAYLFDKNKDILYRLANKRNLWRRRIGVVATHHFIRNDHYTDTLAIAEQLLTDKEDLIHKAVGWMLREVGKRDVKPLESFLKSHCTTMPRTMLRYAIEHFPPKKRLAYLQGKI